MSNILINTDGMSDEKQAEVWKTSNIFRLLLPDPEFFEPFVLSQEKIGRLYFDIDQKFRMLSYQVFQKMKNTFVNGHFDMVVVIEYASKPSDTIQLGKIHGIHLAEVTAEHAYDRGDDYSLILEWYDPSSLPIDRPKQWRFYGSTAAKNHVEGFSHSSMDFCELSF